MSDLRVVIAGAGGRMGRTLVRAVSEAPGMSVTGALDYPESPLIGQDAAALAGLPASGVKIASDMPATLAGADCVIDFTIPQATLALVVHTANAGCAHVIGTTGIEPDEEARIAEAARRTVIVKSGNMSVGVNLLQGLVRRVAATLDAGFDIEVLEMHHSKKIDAPSGTALMLGQAAAEGRGIDLAGHSARGRDGITGARRSGDIGFASLRGGTVVGEHRVIFAGPSERIELVHVAEDRMLFAHGAVRAAQWTRGQPPGLYAMADVLGL